MKKNGFTLIELLISIGILAVVYAISSINLSTIIPSTSQATAYDTLVSDLRSQQTKAMSDRNSYGIHFESGSYTLFKGSTYSSGSPGNFVVSLDPTVTFANVTFPGSQIVFSPGSGDITGYVAGSDSFTLHNSGTGDNQIVRINKYGATY